MLELTYSNRTEALLERLAERVKADRAQGKGPWEPIAVVVPNPYLKEYLRLGLARRLGIAANLHFSYLAGLWKELLGEGAHSILDFAVLRAGLLRVLGDRERLSQEELKPVLDYLGPQEGSLKRVQLARELAKVFEEYQLSRPDWIEAWRAGKHAKGADPVLEAWQSRLWMDVVQALDASTQGGPHLTLLERVRQGGFQGMQLPRSIHAFGLSHVAQAYQEIYRAFVPLEDTTLHIYALNPCCEFWEDLTSMDLPSREKARMGAWDETSEDFYALSSQGPRALRLWGRPGRENIRLLNEVSECDFTPEFEIPLQPTLLGQMQRDILHFEEPSTGDAQPDGSIRCLACPSLRREAEVVATEIWRLLELHGPTEAPLRFSDIAVVVPPGEQEAYQAHLQAAFHDAHRIPMVQSDRALPVMRQTLEAVQMLLALPTSGLTRSALLGVLQHPGLRRRFPQIDPSLWGRWCEEYGIVRGADRAAWAGTYLDRDVLNWDQGLKRLALGAFMTEEAEFQLEAESYRVNGAREQGSVATFMALVRGLCADAQGLLATKTDPQSWIQRLWRYLERWLEIDEGEEAEAVLKALDRIRTYLERMFEGVPVELEMAGIDFTAARHLALEALERLQDEQPANLTKGVVIATYATMRAIPFRAIFLMGLGEGSFPTRNTRSALDLRAKGRRPGDVSQTEKEKYLFLELLLSAREHLALSHVALDELSGEAFEASGLYKEFRSLLGDYLAPVWAPSNQGDPFLETHPLRRFDPVYFPEWFPQDAAQSGLRSYSALAEGEARALWLGSEARRHRILLPSTVGELELDGQDLARLRELLATPGLPKGHGEGEVLALSLQDLRTFLECPLSGAAAVRLGLRRRDLEDRNSLEDEPFESEFLEAWSLQRDVALGALRGGASPEAIYDQHLRRRQDEGAAPFGVFSQVERDRNLQPIEAWVAYLKGHGEGQMPSSWRLGTPGAGRDPADHVLPPLVFNLSLDGRPRRVELRGDLRVQLGGSLYLESGKVPSEGSMDRLRKKALSAFIDHLVLACVDPAHGEHRARFVFEKSKKAPKGASEPIQEAQFCFPALERSEAEGQLQAWIQDLLTGDHGVLLPIEAVLDAWAKKELSADSIRAFVDEALEKGERSYLSTLRGPVPDPTRFPPPPEPTALVERRLGAFLRVVCPTLQEQP